MKHGSLFSGIGGFDLAAQWMGWENVFNCEISPFCRRVLNYYWKNAISYEDIAKTDFTFWAGKVDILTGGFPCQPYSTAGKRLGAADERHLWPEMRRAIREVSPRWVIGENVRGLVSWSGGLVFEQVQANLEAEGYEVWPHILPAAGVGAPHQRYRIWFVAHADRVQRDPARAQGQQRGRWMEALCDVSRNAGEGVIAHPNHAGSSTPGNGTNSNWQAQVEERKRKPQCRPRRHGSERVAPDPTGQGSPFRHETENGGAPGAPPKRKELERNASTTDWTEFPTQPPVLPGDDGLPAPVAGYSLSGWRKEFIAGPGNAIVPQVALNIFRAIEAYEGLGL